MIQKRMGWGAVLTLVGVATFLVCLKPYSNSRIPDDESRGTSLSDEQSDSAIDMQMASTSLSDESGSSDAGSNVTGPSYPVKKPNSQQTNSSAFEHQTAAKLGIDRLVLIRRCERLSAKLGLDLPASESQNCPINHPDAKKYSWGYAQVLVDETVHQLALLKALTISARDSGAGDPFDVAQIAGQYVHHQDDNVREQALGLADLLSESQAQIATQIAARALAMTVSGPLSRQALDLLERHQNVDPANVNRAVVRALKTGGWDVKAAVAERALPFLTEENRAEFAEILAAAPERSKVRLHLRLHMEEFDRRARL